MRQLLEPVHAVVYFAPETVEECGAVGLKGGWMGTSPPRAVPMGAVPADVVAARLRVADRALRRLLGDAVDAPETARTAMGLPRSGGEIPLPEAGSLPQNGVRWI